MTLKTKSEFNFIYKKGKRIHSKFFNVIFLPSDELRFAFVVSKKIGNAVTRNKVKRRLRVIARDLNLEKGWFLFLAKPPIKNARFESLQKDALKCISQIKQ